MKALAAEWPNKITDGPDDSGKMFERPAKLSDPILGPYKNDKEARAAQDGALPPDLSLIAKARNVEYTRPFWAHPFSMLRDIATGYQEGGAGLHLRALLHRLFRSEVAAGGAYRQTGARRHELQRCSASPAIRSRCRRRSPRTASSSIRTAAGSLEQNARDIAAFLAWAADPLARRRARAPAGWSCCICSSHRAALPRQEADLGEDSALRR